MTPPARRRAARTLARVAAVAGAAAAALAGIQLAAVRALADSPAPTASQAAIGDPRGGQAAGFAGDPGLAILVVALIGALAVVATLLWVRATGGPGSPADR